MYAIKFDLSYDSLRQIERGVLNNELVVLTNSIFEGEFIKKCDEILNKERSKLTLDTNSAVKYKFKSRLANLMEDISSLNGVMYFNDFSKRFKCKNIDRDIDWKIVFQDYFSSSPPFGKKNKKSEFPDAFILEMLKYFVNESLTIISSDNDFKSWTKLYQDSPIHIFNSLKKFTEFYVHNGYNDEVVPELIELYHSRSDNIKENIVNNMKKYLNEDRLLELFEDDTNVLWVDISSLSVTECDILNCDSKEDSIVVEYVLCADISAEFEISALDRFCGEDIELSTTSEFSEKASFNGKLKIYTNKSYKNIIREDFYDEKCLSLPFELPEDGDINFFDSISRDKISLNL